MPFPLTPIVGQRHTEVGLKYRWTGSSWDLLSDFQELILSTADPVNGTNTASEGAVWRNTTTGSAWQYSTSGVVLNSPQYFVFNNLGTSSGINWGNPTHKRQSFTLSSASRIDSISVALRRSAGVASGNLVMGLYYGADAVSSASIPISSTNLGQLIQSVSLPDTTTTAATYATFTFNFGAILPPGVYTFVLLSSVATANLVAGISSVAYAGGVRDGGAANDLAFSLAATPASYTSRWDPIVHKPTFQLGTSFPTTQPSGASLVRGDLWYNTTAGAEGLAYWTGTGWVAIRTFYNPAIQNVLLTNDQQSAIDELDVIVDRLALGTNFVGSYNPITNQVDFTTLSGFPDGTLPAASTVGNSSVIVTKTATGQAPAPTIPMNKGDFLVADPVANTWTLIPVGTALDEFTDYLDTPSTYVGSVGYNVAVNATETGLEFVPKTDVQSIYSAGAPALRPNGSALQIGDQWLDASTNREKHWDGAVWQDQVYTIVTATSTPPTSPASGRLWYDKATSTLFIWDTLATKWVAV